QALKFLLHFVPSGAVSLGGQGSARILVERQNVLPQVWSDLLEITFRELIQQMRVRLVGELVFSGMRDSTGIEIGIGELQIVGFHFAQNALVVIQRAIDAGNVQVLSLPSWDLEVE